MFKLQNLLRMIPDGSWNLDKENRLIDPEGSIIEIDSKLDPVQHKLYVAIIHELLNSMPKIISDLEYERQRTSDLFRELRHSRDKIKASYKLGVTDAESTLHDIIVHTPTARDALNEASVAMERLISEQTPIQTDEPDREDNLG